jgi:GT2 family glycosyltransferase
MSSGLPDISLVIVNWNARDLLRACLASLRGEAGGLALEVIVVDNASTDQSVEVLSPEFPEVVWVRNPANSGFAAATNLGLRRARGTCWGLLNPDTVVLPGALARLRQALEAEPPLLAVGPQLLNPDRSLQPSGRCFPSLGRMAGEMFCPRAWKGTRFWLKAMFGRTDFSQPAWVDELSGACLLARRETFERVGFFDEAYFLYFEEVDWFRRLALAGGRARYLPGAQVVHHWGGSSSQAAEASVLANARSAIYYWRKFHGAWSAAALRGLFILRALAGLVGQTAATLVRLRPWSAWATRARLQANLVRLSLGVIK